jgi:hypothetical protein
MSNQSALTSNEFIVAYTALRNTEWVAEPANPVNLKKGLIRKGDTIWFHPDHFGSGPIWQQARLRNRTLRYVHLSDFKAVAFKAKTPIIQ